MPRNPRKAKQSAGSVLAQMKGAPKKAASPVSNLVSVGKAVILTLLAATYSPVSRRTLSPVYGSTAPDIYHRQVGITAIFCGYILRHRLPSYVGQLDAKFLPVLAFFIPTIQYFLFRQSSRLGNPMGPLVTELVTYCPLVLLSVSASVKFLRVSNLKIRRDIISEHLPFVGLFCLYGVWESVAGFALSKIVGSSIFLACSALQLLIAAIYVLTLPSRWVVLATPSLIISTAFNVHMPWSHTTAILNSTLRGYGYTLIDRQESVTGYISVLEGNASFRAMRSDHSLLGGEWIESESDYNPVAKDPIYSVFTMLEAVRLIRTGDNSPTRTDHHSNALVIGLGIGTAPAALIHHGIDTTVIEIDPVVYAFSKKYFHLPSNHTVIIENASTFVRNAAAKSEPIKYDYIVHDVFTGGVEPIDLFTLEFMKGLGSLLKEDGAIAINYAGNIALSSTRLIVRTITTVFPTCRVFRDDEKSNEGADTADLTNMVIFCKKSAATPLQFRRPQQADFLGSRFRELYLLPKHEIDKKVFDATGHEDQRFLHAGNMGTIQAHHVESALAHWKIMRDVLPAEVWENW